MGWTVRGSSSSWVRQFLSYLIVKDLTWAHTKYDKMYTGAFSRGLMWPGRIVEYPPLYSEEVKDYQNCVFARPLYLHWNIAKRHLNFTSVGKIKEIGIILCSRFVHSEFLKITCCLSTDADLVLKDWYKFKFENGRQRMLDQRLQILYRKTLTENIFTSYSSSFINLETYKQREQRTFLFLWRLGPFIRAISFPLPGF